jgi:CRISPR system Cascade subunit CasB
VAEDKNPVDAVLTWHRALWIDTGGNRAARARLRRCVTVLDALMLEESQDLLRRLRRAGMERPDERVALLAMVLARVEPGRVQVPFAEALGRTSDNRRPDPRKEERPRLSPARFGSLLRAMNAREWDDLARALRRALAILNDVSFGVRAFVRDILCLDDNVPRHWTYAYWQTASPDEEIEPQTPANQTEPVS